MARAKKLGPAALARLERDRQALRLRSQGMRWADVAREAGFASAEAAIMAVKALLRRETMQDIETARALHRERLETMIRQLILPALNPGAAVKAARENQQPPPMSQDKAIELMRRLLDDLAKVEGTYAPQKAEVTGPRGPIQTERVVIWQPDEIWLEEYRLALMELPADVQPKRMEDSE